MNEIERLLALIESSPVIRVMRDSGDTWEAVSADQRANPLGLSVRQLQRLYDGEGLKGFDKIKRAVRRQSAQRKRRK